MCTRSEAQRTVVVLTVAGVYADHITGVGTVLVAVQ
jgi:hypothetical protein